jgi:two-component system, NtrC family, response regulator HydG
MAGSGLLKKYPAIGPSVGYVTRTGASSWKGRPAPWSVRLVSATHRDLARAVAREEFREDFYHRLFDLDLRVPPLRERREDISLLLEHFWRSYAAARELSLAGVSPSALRVLEGYGWPGNVRQLEKAVRRAVILRREG